MKNKLSLLMFFLLVIALIGCGNDEQPIASVPTTGTISGNIAIPAGASGSVANTGVYIYATIDDAINDINADGKPNAAIKSVVTDPAGLYKIVDMIPGAYFAGAWKDNNNDGILSDGDFVGVYGNNITFLPKPFSVEAGKNVTINFQMVIF